MKKFLFFICVGLLALTSCEKEPDYSDLDSLPSVFTNYDDKVNFGEYKTFYVPDSILEVKVNECGARGDVSAKKTIAYFISKMEERGYERTDKLADADLAILLSHIQDTNVVYGSWWNYYWDYYYWWDPFYYPWWGGWYYPYPATYAYAYNTNTLAIDMADMKNRNSETGDKKPNLHIIWCSQIDAYQFDAYTLKSSIDQAFEQSPYIKTAK